MREKGVQLVNNFDVIAIPFSHDLSESVRKTLENNLSYLDLVLLVFILENETNISPKLNNPSANPR